MTIFDIYRPFMARFRRRRFEMFLNLLQPKLTNTLLDVGGYPAYWMSFDPAVKNIICLNVHQVDWDSSLAPNHHIKTVIGDGCALSYANQSYDIAYSNSVIEHVGSWENQKKFASEILRVGNAVWVQTPAYECPIEPHYIAPFIHYLPASWQKKLLRWVTPWGWLQKPTQKQIDESVESTRLISYREMQQLFPGCKIMTERLLGILPKSYVAYRCSM